MKASKEDDRLEGLKTEIQHTDKRYSRSRQQKQNRAKQNVLKSVINNFAEIKEYLMFQEKGNRESPKLRHLRKVIEFQG